jgi:chemotaxis protein CheD
MSSPNNPKNIIEINVGGGAVASHPYILTSTGIGSCVVVALYDIRCKVGGTAHIMLPEYPCSSSKNNCAYVYADMAIEKLLQEMQHRGAKLPDIVAKFAGGAKMFSYSDNGKSIGEQNVEKVREVLGIQGIGIRGEDTGGSYGRNIEFYLDTGRMVVKALEKCDKII